MNHSNEEPREISFDDLESMELRILESIWSLERALHDQIEAFKKFGPQLELMEKIILSFHISASPLTPNNNPINR